MVQKTFGFSGKQLASGDINGDATADILISSPGVKIKIKKYFISRGCFRSARKEKLAQTTICEKNVP